MTIINLTPHLVTSISPEGEKYTFNPSGYVARCAQSRTLVDSLPGTGGLFSTKYGEITGLPAEEEGTLLIVSGLVRAALPHRKDLLSPGELVRDERGQPIGCKGFDTNW